MQSYQSTYLSCPALLALPCPCTCVLVSMLLLVVLRLVCLRVITYVLVYILISSPKRLEQWGYPTLLLLALKF